MFKNLIPFRIMSDTDFNLGQLEAALARKKFVPCTPTQKASIGWVTPIAYGDYVHAVDGHWLLTVQIEKKMLPASVIKERLEERVLEIERRTGAKVKSKEKRALKEEVELELLPKAFSKHTRINVWIDRQGKWFGVEGGSPSVADTVTTLFADTLGGPTGLRMIYTAASPSASMTEWLLAEEVPAGFDLDQHCTLTDTSLEGKPTVTYKNHLLDRDDIKAHLAESKLPTALGLQMGDKMSFVMTSMFIFKKMAYLDVSMTTDAHDSHDSFDASFLIAAKTLAVMLDSMIEALGGEDPALVAAAEERMKAPRTADSGEMAARNSARDDETPEEVADDASGKCGAQGDDQDLGAMAGENHDAQRLVEA